MAHTPGPWKAALEGNGYNGAVYVMAGEVELCEVFDDGPTAALPEVENARLMAAAPDLLAALDDCVNLLEAIKEHWVDYDHVFSIGVQDAKAVIAKATGK